MATVVQVSCSNCKTPLDITFSPFVVFDANGEPIGESPTLIARCDSCALIHVILSEETMVIPVRGLIGG